MSTSVSSAWYLPRRHHGSVLLLESLRYSLASLGALLHTSHDTGLFPRVEGLGRKIGDAVVEALLNHLRVYLQDRILISI